MSSIRSAEMAPLAQTITGMTSIVNPDSTHQRRHFSAVNQSAQSPPSQSRPNADRSRTSHYSTFQTRCAPSNDLPPTYATTARQSRFPSAPRHLDNGNEVLPKYTCSVLREGQMFMRVEKISPFQYLPKQQWRPVYVVVQGTQLCIHKVKTSHFAGEALASAGKLIRRYTLQHAEVGLANDVNDNILVPVSRLAHLIPAMARRKAYEKDSDLFRSDKQFTMRVRVETDQILLADRSEEVVFKWVNSISAGIDIAFPIDERNLPRQSTVPRRRRRQQRSLEATADVNDNRLIQEQERILSEMYPALARSVDGTGDGNGDALRRLDTVQTLPESNGNVLALAATNINEQENEDVDLSALAEDFAPLETSISRPSTTRQTTASTIATSFTASNVNPAHFDADGKWAPPHSRSSGSQFRYARRCMPILLWDTPRASSVIICHGRRLRVNQRMDMLEEWELAPPSYDAHRFPSSTPEQAPARQQSVDMTSSARSGSEMDIQAVPTCDSAVGMQGAPLEKTRTRGSSDTPKTNLPTNEVTAHRASTHHNSKLESHNTPTTAQGFTLVMGF